MNRLNTILAAVLVVQLLAILVFASPFGGGAPESLESTALFEGVEPDRVVRMAISDDEGNRVELAREAGDWVLASAGGYPADAARIDPLIEKVTGISGGRPVTRRAKNHAKLSVATSDFARKIELYGDGGAELGTLYAGTSPNYNQLHVRTAGDDAVYVASGVAETDFATSSSRWIDTRWLSLDPDEIRSLVIERGGDRIAIERGDDGGWRMTSPQERSLPVDRVEPILNQFRSAYLSRPVGADAGSYGFDAPTAVITIETATARSDTDDTGSEGEEGSEPEAEPSDAEVFEVHRIFIGGEADGGDGYFAKRTGLDFVVKLMASSVESKFLKDVEDFLPEPSDDASSDDGSSESADPGEGDAGGAGDVDPGEGGGGD